MEVIFSLSKMLLFTMYVDNEYTAKKMTLSCKRLGNKLGFPIEMVWQWVEKNGKLVIACDFHDDE